MAGSLALSGLASGVDTSSIVSQLMAVESQGRTRLTTKQTVVTARQSDLKDVQSKLAALKTAAEALSASATWTSDQTVESSDSARVGVALLGATAGAGATTINVTALASSAQHAYGYTPAAGATITLMRAGAAVGSPIAIAAGTSIEDAATKINAAGLDVSATVVSDGGVKSLVLASKSTGAASDFTISGLDASANTRWERSGSDATYELDDGIERSSPSNVVENAIPGLRLTLKATTPSPVTTTVGSPGLDGAKVKDALKSYVSAYNALIEKVNADVTEKSVVKASTTSDRTKGLLFGDTGLTSLVSRLRSLSASDDPSTSLESLLDIGISTGAASASSSSDAKLGKLTIDDETLSDVLATSPDKLKSVLGNVATTIGSFLGGQGKILDGRISASDTELKSLSDQLRVMDDQLDLKQQRLEAQFAAMETALQQSQTQQAWLTSQLEALG